MNSHYPQAPHFLPTSSARYEHPSPLDDLSPSSSDFVLSLNPSNISSYRFPDDTPSVQKTHPRTASAHQVIAHPYARLYAKKDSTKRHRKIWSHALEKSLFNSHELSTMGAPHRRTIYIASLEAHIDRLHAQLLSIGLYPIPFDKLEPYRGLNSKTAKSMVAGLQNDASHTKLKLLELERSSSSLRDTLGAPQVRRHSVDSSRPTNYY